MPSATLAAHLPFPVAVAVPRKGFNTVIDSHMELVGKYEEKLTFIVGGRS